MTTTAKIAAKGTKATGLTEEIAKRLHDQLGKTIIAIVEITSEARTEKKSGDEEVKLSLGMIEVAPDGSAADHVRELARSFHYERKLAEDGPTLTEGDGPEPKVTDVLAAGARFRPHPYLASTLSTDDDAVCDVCGQHEPAAVHSVQDTLPDTDDTQHNDSNDDGNQGEGHDEPHQFEPDHDNSCLHCGRYEDEDGNSHTAADETGDEWTPTIPNPFTTPTPA